MDASAQVICGKSQKLETEEGRNLIRNIPDVILQHILSFLPMKDVVIAYYLKDGKTYGCWSPFSTLKKKAYLVTGGELKTDFCLYSSTLVNGCMDWRSVTVSEWYGKQREAAYHMRELLKGFSSVESLTVSPVALEILTRAEELYSHLPVFHKLNLLKFGYGTMNFDYGALQRIFPCLKNMEKKL